MASCFSGSFSQVWSHRQAACLTAPPTSSEEENLRASMNLREKQELLSSVFEFMRRPCELSRQRCLAEFRFRGAATSGCLARVPHTPELTRRRCSAEFRFREADGSESEFRATGHLASDGTGLRRKCEKCGPAVALHSPLDGSRLGSVRSLPHQMIFQRCPQF